MDNQQRQYIGKVILSLIDFYLLISVYYSIQNQIMRKRDTDNKKHLSNTQASNILHQFKDKDLYINNRHVLSSDIHEQLRGAIQQLQHHRLTSELEVQKRILLQQQLKTLRQQLDEQRQQNSQLRKEYGRVSKKYSKAKQKKACQKCKTTDETADKLQKEREIYINDRKILQDEIKYLKLQLQQSDETQERQNLTVLVDSLRKQLYLSGKKIEQQAQLIRFMSEKLSICEVENVQIMNNVQLLENRLSDLEMQKAISKKQRKPYQDCNTSKSKGRFEQQRESLALSLSKKRKNGSIQNIKKGKSFTDQLQRYES